MPCTDSRLLLQWLAKADHDTYRCWPCSVAVVAALKHVYIANQSFIDRLRNRRMNLRITNSAVHLVNHSLESKVMYMSRLLLFYIVTSNNLMHRFHSYRRYITTVDIRVFQRFMYILTKRVPLAMNSRMLQASTKLADWRYQWFHGWGCQLAGCRRVSATVWRAPKRCRDTALAGTYEPFVRSG